MSNIITTQNNDKFRGMWTPNTFYRQDDMVFDGTSLWIALADFTSGATFDSVNWFCPGCPEIIETSYKTAVLSSNPDAYWILNEIDSSSLLIDSSGNSNHLTVSGTLLFEQPVITPSSGHTSIDFEYGMGTLSNPKGQDLALNNKNISVEFWFNTPVPNVDPMAVTVLSGPGVNTFNSNYQLYINVNSNGSIATFWEHGNGVNDSYDDGSVISTNTNYYVAVVKDDALKVVNFYINGVLTATEPYLYNPDGGSDSIFTLGDRLSGGRNMRYLSNVALYKRVLSPSEISNHYLAGI